tara:strand:- start:1446 stop:1958 length:513 start_codon:yes stop_codon:yes gene_type:complete
MAQEFTIKSQDIEDKINQLLPSQGGFQAGVDFSASTMVIPIVDLTETAEGSSLRVDLQSSLSLTSMTTFSITNASNTTIINTTGYYRVFGTSIMYSNNTSNLNITDGTTTKNIINFGFPLATADLQTTPFDFTILLQAGDTLRGTATSNNSIISGNVRQLADLSGNLVNP